MARRVCESANKGVLAERKAERVETERSALSQEIRECDFFILIHSMSGDVSGAWTEYCAVSLIFKMRYIFDNCHVLSFLGVFQGALRTSGGGSTFAMLEDFSSVSFKMPASAQ